MAKLNKRQIIIIIIALMAVLYGAYAYLSGGPARKESKTISDPNEKNIFISSITSELMKSPLSIVDVYIISRAETDWQRNPFMERSSYKEWAARDSAKGSDVSAVAKIIYSGYVDSGKKKMAVINGLEYSVGEQLEIGGYVLKKITERKVVIRNRNTGSELEISIQE
jgi:hypothetical protein